MRSRTMWIGAACAVVSTAAFAQDVQYARGTIPGPLQKCSPNALPASLPSVTQLVDSATLVTLIAGPPALPQGESLFSVGFDATGAAVRFLTLESTLPDSALRQLLRSAASLLEPQPQGQPRRVRLKIVTGDRASLRVERSEDCAVSSSTLGNVSFELGRGLRTFGNLPQHSGHTVVVNTVSAAGFVTDTRLIETTLSARFDSAAVMGARAVKYYPALADRTPVAAVDTLMLVYIYSRGDFFFGEPREARKYELRVY